MQKYLSQIYRMAHNWWYKKDYWTWKNKSKIWNIIFSYDDLFLKKTSLKIFQVRLNLAIYLIISLFIRLFDRTFCSTILFNKLLYYLNLLFRAIYFAIYSKSYFFLETKAFSFKASRWYSAQRKISCYNVYLLFSPLGFLQYERKLRQPFYVYH